MRDRLRVSLGRHNRREFRFIASEPGEGIHELCNLGRALQVNNHEDMSPGRIPIDGLRLETRYKLGKKGARTFPFIYGVSPFDSRQSLYQVQHCFSPFFWY